MKTIEVRFAPGDKAWAIRDNKVKEGVITCLVLEENLEQYKIRFRNMHGIVNTYSVNINDIFPTKQELLDSL